MKIEVTEGTYDGGFVQQVIDEKRFVKLYGKDDLKRLKNNRSVGDVIGQNRWYRAKLLEP